MKRSILILAAILSLLFCLVPLFAWAGVLVPWLVIGFTVANESGETLFITPVTHSGEPVEVIIPQRYAFGQLRAFRQADLPLAPGESRPFWYDVEGPLPTALVLRNEAGQYRQLALERGARGVIGGPEVIYVIEEFERLPEAESAVQAAAREAGYFEIDFRFWGSMLLCTGVGLLPAGLLIIWLRLKRGKK